ncbi:MAG: beta-Ala-His dipeptidase, partial [Negativicutes bacterium]|nr:beta-Ala-His dipeptidase [Negativicutes bacterium]
MENLQQLLDSEPRRLWQYFAAICRIPHGSKNEKAVAEYVCGELDRLGLSWERDDVGNILARKPAASGLESAAGICLQGHLDMVCEKNAGTQHDFLRDGLQLKVQDGFLMAEGTTLGADNGIGVAAALAILADNKIRHGPVEALFTVDEEDGMTGAKGLRPGWLQSRYLLNLDSEEEGEFCIGCAGGRGSTVSSQYRPVRPTPGKSLYRLKVFGLKGGHSGVNIKDGLANGIKLLVRFLFGSLREFSLEVASIRGGNKVNAICREAWADVYVSAELVPGLRERLENYRKDLANEYAGIEDGIAVDLSPLDGEPEVMSMEDDWRLISYLYAAPHGVKAMSGQMPGLVQTSTNLAFVDCDGGRITVKMSHRSSVAVSYT